MVEFAQFLVVIMCSTMAWVVPLFFAKKYGYVNYVSPLHFVSYMAFWGIFVKTIGYVFDPTSAFMYGYVDSIFSFYVAYIYVLLFIAAICVGYVLSVNRPASEDLYVASVSTINSLKNLKVVFPLTILLTVAVVLLLLQKKGFSELSLQTYSVETIHALQKSKITQIEGVSGFGSSFASLQIFFVIPLLVFVLYLSKFYLRKRIQTLLPIGVLLCLVLAIVFVTSKRLQLLELFVYSMIVYFIIGGNVNFKLVRRSLFVVASIFCLFSLMTFLRASKGDLDFSTFEISTLFNQIVYSTYFLDINVPAIIIDRSYLIDYSFGKTYLSWTYGLIPREFWPDKPAINLGPYVKQVILGLKGTFGGINPTGPGEAFLNFGWFGIAVGLILGFLYRKAEEITLSIRCVLNSGGIWIYALVVYPFIQGTLQSTFSGIVTAAIVKLVICYLLFKIVISRTSYRE